MKLLVPVTPVEGPNGWEVRSIRVVNYDYDHYLRPSFP